MATKHWEEESRKDNECSVQRESKPIQRREKMEAGGWRLEGGERLASRESMPKRARSTSAARHRGLSIRRFHAWRPRRHIPRMGRSKCPRDPARSLLLRNRPRASRLVGAVVVPERTNGGKHTDLRTPYAREVLHGGWGLTETSLRWRGLRPVMEAAMTKVLGILRARGCTMISNLTRARRRPFRLLDQRLHGFGPPRSVLEARTCACPRITVARRRRLHGPPVVGLRQFPPRPRRQYSLCRVSVVAADLCCPMTIFGTFLREHY